MRKIGTIFLVLLATIVFASSSWAVDDLVRHDANYKNPQALIAGKKADQQETRMPGHMETVLPELFGQRGPWVAPRVDNQHLDLESVVWVDDSYTGSEIGFGTTLFNTIREGVAAVNDGGVVNVYPGSYLEATPGCFLYDASGPYQFGLFFGAGKNNYTIQGVDAGGVPITSHAGILADVSLNATNGFGPSGLFVEANGITVSGLELYQTGPGYNKCVEVIGDDFTMMYCEINDGTSLYVNDFRFDNGSNTSYVQSYHIEGNLFTQGTSVDLASGAGFTGSVSSRQIINNDFVMDSADDYWPAISFNGSGSGVPWFVYSVGAAVITGNSFTDAEQLYIRHRGDFANYGDFDWQSYWNNNTFDKKVMFGVNPPTVQGSYSYTSGSYVFNNVKEIGAGIQREIDRAASGDVVLCGDGTYSESPVVDKPLTLRSENPHDANIALQTGPTYLGTLLVNADDVSIDGFTITGRDAANPVLASTNIYIEVGSDNASILNNLIKVGSIDGGSNGDDGFGLVTPYSGSVIINDLTVSGNTFEPLTTNGQRGFYINPGVDGFVFTDNVISGMLGSALTQARNGVVENNTMTGTGVAGSRTSQFAAWSDPDGTWGNTLFRRNTISGCLAGITIYSTDDCQIEENFINSNDYGVRFYDLGDPWDPATDVVFNNSISNSNFFAIYNDGALVNASGNWLGSNSEAAVIASVSAGSVDYSPFLDSNTDTSPSPGFQGDFHVLNVSASSPISGALNHIEEALDMTTGSTLNLSAGTYGGFAASAFSNLNIIGVAGSTFISPATLVATGVGHKYTPSMLAAVFINNCTNVSLQNLSIEDGTGLTPGAGGADAIVFWNASSGSMIDCSVHGTYTISGVQSGQGIAVDASAPASSSLTLNNCTIDGFQKNGVDVVDGNTAAFGGGNITFNMNGGAITGAGATGVIAQNGILFWSRAGGTVGGTIDGAVISSFEYTGVDDASAVLLYNANGPTTVQNCKLTAELPAVDYVSGHTWDSNCYSDYASNPGYPGTYEVEDNEVGAPLYNVDNNPNPNGCSDVNLVLSDPLIGCGTGCNTFLLYITLDLAGLPNLEVIIDLPAGFTAQLPPTGGVVTPGSNADPNLIQAYAIPINSGTKVQVDMGFQGLGSTGDNIKYVACIPIVNNSATSGIYSFIGSGSMWLDFSNVQHINELMLGSIDVEVDCTVPVITDFLNNASCSFGSASQLVDAFSATFTDADADLESAWVTFTPSNGNYQVFNTTQVSGYAPTFPPSGDEGAFYANLQVGCNTLTLHLLDTECNETTVDLLNVGRDNTAPGLNVTDNLNGCYNNATAEAALEADLAIEITQLDLVNCNATTGTLTITSNTNPGGTPYTLALSGDLSGFPGATYSTALWMWMTTSGQGNVPAGANGETYEFSAVVNDCAGNVSGSQTFDLCIDFVLPGNTVTTLDARPADGGVWLNWEWTPDVSQAVEMRIYRSPHTPNGTFPAGYPGYDPQLLDSYDVTPGAFSGWTLVANEFYGSGEYNSQDYTGNNNRLGDPVLHHGTYWLDAENGWINGDAYPDELPGPLPNATGPDALSWRDIYRYVTFVKDAAGNWSTGYTPVKGLNVDHATNYWLGDFAPADVGGYNNSRGRVDSDDLSLLSAVYFGSGTYQNIGPVVSPVENGGVGKSTPNFGNDHTVNFFDLAPFSFNYGAVGRYGNALEFVVEPDHSVYKPVNRLDAAPVVSLDVLGEPTFEVGSEFTVVVSLSGNDAGVVKAAQALLNYDEMQLEVVASSIGSAVTSEGTLFAKVNSTSESGQIGLVAAACGGYSTLDDNATLGTVTFRVKTELQVSCEIELSSIQMLDNTGEIIDVEGETYPLFSAPSVPDNYALYQNYPNPFNPTTNIQFDLKEAGQVKIMVYNTLGQLVALAADNRLDAGRHIVSFDASTLASGVYIYTINVNGFSDLKKMVLIK